MVFGPQTYHLLPEMVAKVTGAYGRERIINTDFPVEEKFDHLPQANGVTGPAAYLSIQEGCDKFCTFCVVPYTRGSEYSRNTTSILDEAIRLMDGGVKDITLLGQNVNAFHGVAPDGSIWSLARLIEEIATLDGVERIRYMTSHPCDVLDDLIAAHRDIPKLMPFLHLPVQSGSDKILKAMNRKHTAQDYRDTIARFRAARPDISISSDFIIGFPGESDQDFEDTFNLVKEIGFGSAFSFKYSARPGTPAANMQGLIRESIKDERLQRLQAEIIHQAEQLNKSFIGKSVQVLFDGRNTKTGQLHGRSIYNQTVHAEANDRLYGSIAEVEITRAGHMALHGHVKTVEN